MMSLRALVASTGRRRFSTSALDAWIAQPQSVVLPDTITANHLADLYITLPTRDGSRHGSPPFQPPTRGTPLGYGHHLVFFHPRNPERDLGHDGTDTDFCPPDGLFTRRMWASGTVRWNNKPGGALMVGDDARAVSTVASVEKKGFDGKNPMMFVKQRIDVTADGRTEPSIVEERTHVYLVASGSSRGARPVTGLPRPDFSFTYKPSPTTLFRFSALTFNGHYIHLENDFAQKVEGHAGRLVHGPLTALLMLEVLQLHKPGLQLHDFEYRARNPVVVNRNSTIYGAFAGENKAILWCADDDGVVGMTGSVTFSQ